MKRRKWILLIGLILLLMIVSIGVREVRFHLYRYDSPAEALADSEEHDSQLVDVLQREDIALVVYQNDAGTFGTEFVFRDARGWTPMMHRYLFDRTRLFGYGRARQIYVDGRYAVDFIVMSEQALKVSSITDEAGTDYVFGQYATKYGQSILIGFAVTQKEFPDPYTLYADGVKMEELV